MTDGPRTARARAREQITAEILGAARLRLTHHGPGELSLRAVARDVGMVSSAIYRYFAGRDELLTALLVVAYDEIGAAAEAADVEVIERSGLRDHRGRMAAVARAIRGWAIDHPGDYALLYGSPVPGYEAPQDTIPAASRIPVVFIGIIADAAREGILPAVRQSAESGATAHGGGENRMMMNSALGFLRDLGVPDDGSLPEITTRTLMAWATIFGSISFELFGQLVGSIDDYRAWFDHVVDRLADDLGFTV